MDISELRSRIDDIDAQLSSLFLQRMEVSAAIGAYKKERSLPVYDPQREKEIIDKIAQNSPKELADYVARLYEEIFALSREYQQKLEG